MVEVHDERNQIPNTVEHSQDADKMKYNARVEYVSIGYD